MTQEKRMLAEKLYCADDPELQALMVHKREILSQFNDETNPDQKAKEKLLLGLFAHVGKNAFVAAPFRCDYGCHISVGDNFYANYDCIFLDVNRITIGDNVFMAPRVCIYTAGHPIDKDVRNAQLEYGYPVTIGNDVWIGGNVVINPGVTIGDDVVIGSGSVVTHSLPSHTVCAGVPCRVLRTITKKDKDFWEEQRQAYEASL
ncbi:MAG: sugar O-acetyltransferase [Bacilli bacterium]|jgi:maltose O-acetyltransferase|nr:sugar O-acetyltransferase [Bacilli bacterium]